MRMKKLPETFGREVMFGSGAMGTHLRTGEHSAWPCIEWLNVQEPKKVAGVHEAYRDAGAQVLVTNTFAASPLRLRDSHHEDSCVAINEAGVKVAREAAAGQAAVWCSVGPLNLSLRLADFSDDELTDCYREQVQALTLGDALVLETFREVREARAALTAAKETDLPVIFQTGGVRLARAADLLALALDAGVEAVGTNCSHPTQVVQLVEFLVGACELPVTAFPNAGTAHMDRGFVAYDFEPTTMLQVAKKCLDAGASLVGGCCGTTPAHIAQVVRGVGQREVIARETLPVSVVTRQDTIVVDARGPNAIRNLMKSDSFVISVEVRPSRMKALSDIVSEAQQLVDAGVNMLDVPDNAAAVVGRDAMVTASALQHELEIPCVAHKSVTQTNLLNLHSSLLGCWDSGLQGLLCISGDPPATGHLSGQASRVTDLRSSVELLRLLGTLRGGELINGDRLADPPDFCGGCGVGSGPKLGPQIRWLGKKVDAGAEFVFSQPVFSIDQFRALRDEVSQFPIRLFPGLFPVPSLRGAEFLASGGVPGINVPDSYVEMLTRYSKPEDQKSAGMDFARDLAMEVAAESSGIYIIMPFSKTCYTDTAELVRSVRAVKA